MENVNRPLKKIKIYFLLTGILSFIIVLSTMFLKQHSVTDVAAALVMDGILYQLVYARQARQARKLMHEPVI